MWQTVFSKELLKRFKPRCIRSVAVCTADDAVLRPLLERHNGCAVRVDPGRHAARGAEVRAHGADHSTKSAA